MCRPNRLRMVKRWRCDEKIKKDFLVIVRKLINMPLKAVPREV